VGRVQVQASGRYEAWLQGSFSEPVQVWIDGRKIGSASYELGPPGQSTEIGELELRAGTHRISIVVPHKGLAPGVTLANQTLGPLTLAPAAEAQPVGEVEPADARSLCGRSLDWIEIVR
jgi:hypothetical protein